MKTTSFPVYQAAVLLPLALIQGVAGVTQTVQVGPRGLVFQPESFTANVGDVIEFVIHTTHNVARSSFGSPCVPIGGGQDIWSGDDLPNNTVFSVTVNDTNPIWLYCATSGHCQNGMAAVINPPSSSSQDLTAYKAAALNVANSVDPTDVTGGIVGAPSGGSSSSSSSGGASTTASSSAASSSTTSRSGSSAATTTTSRASVAATSSSASPTTTPNAAPTMLADWKMIGGVILGGAALVL